MREEVHSVRLEGAFCTVKLLFIEEDDRAQLRQLFDAWKQLFTGMQEFRARGINMPEGISESAFCLEYGSARVLEVHGSSGSFDTFDIERRIRQQIKATSVEDDLTSFGPKSVWDEFFWLDFYRDGRLDGGFDVYRIPTELFNPDFPINRNQTFRDQQRQGRRPRLSIRQRVVNPNNLRPERACRI